MGNTHTGSSGGQAEAGRQLAEGEALFRPAGELEALRRTFGQLAAASPETAPEGAEGSAGVVSRAALEDLFAIPAQLVPAGQAALCRQASRALVAVCFPEAGAQKGVDWGAFLRGVARCCKPASSTEALNIWLAIVARARAPAEAELPAGAPEADKQGAWASREALHDLFFLSFLLICSSRLPAGSTLGAGVEGGDWPVDLSALEEGALAAHAARGGQKMLPWLVASLPGLCAALPDFVRTRCAGVGEKQSDKGEAAQAAAGPGGEEGHQLGHASGSSSAPQGLLSCSTALTVGLGVRSKGAWGPGPLLLDLACGGGPLLRLQGAPRRLYSASVDGGGMNRFMQAVGGYSGTVLLLLKAHSSDQQGSFVLGALVLEGFKQESSFYGSAGCCLFALAPQYAALRTTGGASNHVYSHAKAAGEGYKARPVPNGVGFGGVLGKERVWLDEDFNTVTLRHHAVDKVYQAGDLVPGQGYAAVVASVNEVEVYGLGGQHADERQRASAEREQRFLEQKRKVNLANFAGDWENSPDKMMLDLVSTPT